MNACNRERLRLGLFNFLVSFWWGRFPGVFVTKIFASTTACEVITTTDLWKKGRIHENGTLTVSLNSPTIRRWVVCVLPFDVSLNRWPVASLWLEITHVSRFHFDAIKPVSGIRHSCRLLTRARLNHGCTVLHPKRVQNALFHSMWIFSAILQANNTYNISS